LVLDFYHFVGTKPNSNLLKADLNVLEIQRPGVMTGPKVPSKTKKVS
jgi:hypothetical protein